MPRKNTFQNHKEIVFLISVLFCAFLIVLTFYTSVLVFSKIKEINYIGRKLDCQHTILVNGVGEVYAKPDTALITFSVKNEAKTVDEALSENVQRMNAVIEAIKEEGIESKNLKTTNLSIYPRYEWHKEGSEEAYPEGKRVLVGYEVVQSLEVKIKDLSMVGKIIEKATEKGANQVGSLRFVIDNQEEIKKEARRIAIENAKEKAKELAQQLGVRLGRVFNFSESSVLPPYILEKSAVAQGSSETPQIEPGQNKIRVQVSITYEIE